MHSPANINSQQSFANGQANETTTVTGRDQLQRHNHTQNIQLGTGLPDLIGDGADDHYEQEADAVADTIMRMPGQNFIQRKCSHCEEENIQRKPLVSFIQRKEMPAGTVASETVSNSINSGRGNGQHMDNDTRSFMQSRFGADFSNVKIHTDSESIQMSRELNAKAFTVGNDIYFNEGEYDPGSGEGKYLLAHELTHTLQQGSDKTVRRQKKADEKAESIPTSYIFVQGHGNQVNGVEDMQGINDKDIDQKLGDLYRERKVCWEGDYVGIELFFGTSPIPGDGSSPRKISPFISAKLSYKEAGGFTSYRYQGSDNAPVWYSGPSANLSANWNPMTMQTLFVYPLNKKGTLDIHVEMMDIEDDRLLVYKDKIDFIKCNVAEACRENALATGRWAVIPDDGGPIHPLTGTADDGARYEIYKESGKDNYFICTSEFTRLPVDRSGNPAVKP